MDQHKFWDIIKKITTTLFCVYTPKDTEEVYIELEKNKKSKIDTNKDKDLEGKNLKNENLLEDKDKDSENENLLENKDSENEDLENEDLEDESLEDKSLEGKDLDSKSLEGKDLDSKEEEELKIIENFIN